MSYLKPKVSKKSDKKKAASKAATADSPVGKQEKPHFGAPAQSKTFFGRRSGTR